MLPSSFSHLAKCGQMNHYKKFWIMQTQLEKQESSCSTASTSLCLGIGTGNMSTMKESKLTSAPLLFNGDNSNSAPSRPETAASCTTSRASVFPFCPPSPSDPLRASSMSYISGLGYPSNKNFSYAQEALSLAVNCASDPLSKTCVPINMNRRCRASPASEAYESTCITSLPPPTTSSPRSTQNAPLFVQLENQVSCKPSECFPDEEKGRDASTSNSNTLHHVSSSFNLVNIASNDALSSPSGRSFVVRSCTLCGTTKTPLWRSGPDGPKSLCNACGIRMKKSRRQLQASTEGGSSSSRPPSYKSLLASAKSSGRSVKRKLSNDSDDEEVHNKKLSRFTKPLRHCPKRIKGGLMQTDASDKVARLLSNRAGCFTKVEEEAAVLLMALSCGLVLS